MRILLLAFVLLCLGCEDELPIDNIDSECLTGHIDGRDIVGSCYSSGEQLSNSFKFLFTGSFQENGDDGVWITCYIRESTIGTHDIIGLSSALMELGGCNPLLLRGNVSITDINNDRVKGSVDLDLWCNQDEYDGFLEFDLEVE